MSSSPGSFRESAAPGSVKDLLFFAGCAGLLTGLVQGAGLFLFQKLGWLGWTMRATAMEERSFWVSPVFDPLLLEAASAPLAVEQRIRPRVALQWETGGLLREDDEPPGSPCPSEILGGWRAGCPRFSSQGLGTSGAANASR
jgi:hypothetical protein